MRAPRNDCFLLGAGLSRPTGWSNNRKCMTVVSSYIFSVLLSSSDRRRRTMNIWTRKLTKTAEVTKNKRDLFLLWSQWREGEGGAGWRYSGKGDDAVRFKYVFKGWGGGAWFKTIWKLVLHGTSRVYHLELQWVVLPDKVQPRLFCGCFTYMQIFQLSLTFIFSFQLISNNFVVTFLNGYTSKDVCGSIQNVSEIKRQVKSCIFFSLCVFSLCFSSQFACCYFLLRYDG